jgi:OmpA-OmpF porin, OOP family
MKKMKTMLFAVIIALLTTGLGWAEKADKAGSQDHPLISRIPGFYISSYTDMEFDQHLFQTAKGKIAIAGRKYTIAYSQQKDQKVMSSLQKVRNHTQAIKKISGEILKDNPSSAVMKIQKGKREIYIQISNPYGAKSYYLVIVEKGEMRQDVVAHAEILDAAPKKKETVITDKKEDKPGSQDHPLLSRIPDFYISSYQDIEFGQYKFKTKKGKVTVEGRKFEISYTQQKGAQTMSGLQKVRNYTNAIKKINGEIFKEESNYGTMKVVADNREIWIQVSNPYGARAYHLVIVEKGVMKQEVTADAEAMLEDIQKTGHVAVYGIHFDTGKATLKPTSEPAFKEITRLLKKNPKLNIYVVGHTDMKGTLSSNMSLASARAASVVKELTVKYKISSKRLTPKGVGPLCPMDSNRSKTGKAKNRRVDLVEKI